MPEVRRLHTIFITICYPWIHWTLETYGKVCLIIEVYYLLRIGNII